MKPLTLPMLLLLSLALFPSAPAGTIGPGLTSGFQVIGRGCTTAYFIDQDCDGCGTGVKSSNQYPVTVYWAGNATTTSGSTTVTINSTTTGYLQAWSASVLIGTGIPAGTSIASFGTYTTVSGVGTITLSAPATATSTGAYQTGLHFSATPYWTMGDTPDADDTDPTVCSSADWQAKWGWSAPTSGNRAADNAAFVNFLSQKKGFNNTANIYYIATTGNDATCAVNGKAIPNQPDLPCASAGPVLAALSPFVTTFTGSINTTAGSNIITITITPTSGALTYGTLLKASTLPGAGVFVQRQLDGATSPAAGAQGTYQVSANALSSGAANGTGTNLAGGLVVARSGVALNLNSCATSPCFKVSGSPGHTLYIMAFPGEIATIPNGFSATGLSFSPGQYACCLILDGLQSAATSYALSDAAFTSFITDWTLRNMEIAGFDDGFFVSNYSRNVTTENSVFHDNDHHAVYYSTGSSQVTIQGTLVNGSTTLTITSGTGSVLNPFLGATVCVVSACNGIAPLGNQTQQGASQYTWIVSQLSGAINAPGTYQMNRPAVATVSTAQSMVLGTSAAHGGQAPDFNFALEDTYYWLGESNGVQYNMRATGNVAYNNGNSGYEPFHINTTIDGAYLLNNIASYSGGAGAAFQTGIYNGIAAGNTFFDNGADCMNLFLNKSIVPQSIRWALIINNVCWNGGPTTSVTIRAASPGGGWSQRNPGQFNAQNGPAFWVKDSVFTGNVIVGDYTSSAGIGAFEMDEYSYPLTNTITGNSIWDEGNANCCIMQVDPLAQGLAGGTYTGAQFLAAFPSNTVLSANPYANASQANYLTPGNFNFAPYNHNQ